MTFMTIATSRALRVIGPGQAKAPAGLAGYAGTRPPVALKPVVPVSAAGIRLEPPASVPNANGVNCAATDAAAPPLDPPDCLRVFHGLRVMPVSGLIVTGPT